MVYGSIAFGLLGVVATVLLTRRLFGPFAGLAAGALLAFNGLQLWFARQTLTEVFLQALLVGGLMGEYGGGVTHTSAESRITMPLARWLRQGAPW